MVNNVLSRLPTAEAPGPMASLSPARRLLCSRAFLPFLALFVFFYYAALLTNGDFILWAPAIHPGDSEQSVFGFVYINTLLHLWCGVFIIVFYAIVFEAS